MVNLPRMLSGFFQGRMGRASSSTKPSFTCPPNLSEEGSSALLSAKPRNAKRETPNAYSVSRLFGIHAGCTRPRVCRRYRGGRRRHWGWSSKLSSDYSSIGSGNKPRVFRCLNVPIGINYRTHTQKPCVSPERLGNSCNLDLRHFCRGIILEHLNYRSRDKIVGFKVLRHLHFSRVGPVTGDLLNLQLGCAGVRAIDVNPAISFVR
jgi:hypothetical protein